MEEQLALIKPVYVLEIEIPCPGEPDLHEEFGNVFDALRQAMMYMESSDYIVKGIKVDGEYVMRKASINSVWLLLGNCPDGYWITEEGENENV